MQEYICKVTCKFEDGSIIFTKDQSYISLDTIGVLAVFIDDQGNKHEVDKRYLTKNFELNKEW